MLVHTATLGIAQKQTMWTFEKIDLNLQRYMCFKGIAKNINLTGKKNYNKPFYVSLRMK